MNKKTTNAVLKPAGSEATEQVIYRNDDGAVTDCGNLAMLAMGTHGQGEIGCAYTQLVARFGKPGKGDGCKTQAEWLVCTPAGIATIYDWKQGDCYHGPGNGTPVEEVTEWSIGGHNKSVVEWIQKAISATA